MSLKLTAYSYVRVQRESEYGLGHLAHQLGLRWDITGAKFEDLVQWTEVDWAQDYARL